MTELAWPFVALVLGGLAAWLGLLCVREFREKRIESGFTLAIENRVNDLQKGVGSHSESLHVLRERTDKLEQQVESLLLPGNNAKPGRSLPVFMR